MHKLHIINGRNKGRSFELKGDTTFVGRAPENDIQIRDESISRRHLVILRKVKGEGKGFFVKDLQSTNGTFVNGKLLVPGEEFEVQQGMPITIGEVVTSLGKAWSEEVTSIHDSTHSSDELSDTGMFPSTADRPMSTPRNLELIYKVANVLMQSLDINETLERILYYIFELLRRIDRGVIILVDNETGRISEVISRSKRKGDKTKSMYSRTIVNRAMREGKPIVMSDTVEKDGDDLSESMELMKVKSVMCVPLMSRSQIRGVIYVDSVSKPYGFREEDLSLLTALSSPAAIAIENALLYSNLEKIVEERTRSLQDTEKKLRESEARFKAIFANMSSGVIVYEAIDDGEDFLILDSNRAARKIEKLKKTALTGKRVLDLFPAYKRIGLLDVFRSVWKTGKPEHRSVTFYEDEIITGWREFYVYRLHSGEIVSIFDDITDKRKAEEEQRALQKQLLVSQKMESIGTFAGGTAHNFRNILQAILGNIEYLDMVYGDKPEISELTKSIYDSVERGVDLINNLLHFSKRGGDYDLVYLDLAEVITKTYEIIDRVFKKNIDIDLNLERDLFVRGSHSLLSQVFMNLFSNASDAMPDGGKLVIEARKLKDKVVAIVSDTGHGMDKETLEKAFDPFFTLKDVGKGTGLGLSTTHGIIEQHKGSISVSSKPGQGTTFTISLPAAKAENLKEPAPQKKIIYGKGEKVLIVDDERPALDSLTNLATALGYETISVDRSVEALENYGKWKPDVVLMDRSMPQMDGNTCIKKILKTDPKARVVIVSGYEESGAGGIDGTLRGQIKGYITKPCRLEELSHTLSKALKA